MDHVAGIERAAPKCQAVVGVEDGELVEQRFFALVKSNVTGEEEDPTAGKQRLVRHRGEDRIRLESQLAWQTSHGVLRNDIVVGTVVRVTPLVGAGVRRLDLWSLPRCDGDAARMQYTLDLLRRRRGRNAGQHPDCVGHVAGQPE